MSRDETLAGLTEAIAGHESFDYDDDRNAWFCECDECIAGPLDRNIRYAAHVAAVALAWLEGHGWAEFASDSQPVRTYYSSYTPDGKLWCQTRDPEEVKRMSEGRDCTFERLDVHQYGVVTAWAPVETGDQK